MKRAVVCSLSAILQTAVALARRSRWNPRLPIQPTTIVSLIPPFWCLHQAT